MELRGGVSESVGKVGGDYPEKIHPDVGRRWCAVEPRTLTTALPTEAVT